MNWEKIIVYIGMVVMLLVALHASLSFIFYIGRAMFK
jgi:hypothetical protein